jgi:hypothetical protein
MKFPQIAVIALYALSVGISIAKHGQAQPPVNAGYSIVSAIIVIALLWMGGFFG